MIFAFVWKLFAIRHVLGAEGYCGNVRFFFWSNPMDDCVVVVSVNCHCLGNRQKRKDVFHYLRNKKYSIYFLQDAHFEPKMENVYFGGVGL